MGLWNENNQVVSFLSFCFFFFSGLQAWFAHGRERQQEQGGDIPQWSEQPDQASKHKSFQQKCETS